MVFSCQIAVLQYLFNFSAVSDESYNLCESQNLVCRWLWTVKNVFFGISGHLETLKTGKTIVTMAAFMTN
jgi:hypothetical protein